MTAHARLGCSNHRWVHCPGSIREEAAYENVSGEAAIDGTGSHLLLEMCVKAGVDADSYLGNCIGVNDHDKPNGWDVKQDRIDRVQQCLNYISRRVFELKEKHPNADVNVYAESLSSPGKFTGRNDWWGTCDITIEVVFEEVCMFIEVVDYKDGRMYVTEKNNSQLQGYLGGKVYDRLRDPDFPCRMTIVQPKTNPSVRYQDSTKFEIIGAIEKLSKAAALTDDPEAELIAGDHCTWCLHKSNCSKIPEQSLERLKDMTENTELIGAIESAFSDVEGLSESELSSLADAKEVLMSAFDKVNAEIERRIGEGTPVKGYAMLPGRSSKVWSVSEEELVGKLKARRLKKDEIYPSKLITPAALLKLGTLTKEQKKKIEDQFITVKQGASSLRRVSHDEEEKDVNSMFEKPAEKIVSFL